MIKYINKIISNQTTKQTTDALSICCSIAIVAIVLLYYNPFRAEKNEVI